MTLDQIVQGEKKQWELKNPKLNNKLCGTLLLQDFKATSESTFLEYLRSGIQLNVVCAVDFTGSNGHPLDDGSLHNMKSNSLNPYQKSIMGVCDILLDYDYDKNIPMYGFGAKRTYIGEKSVNHCFSMTRDENNPYASGLDGIMQVYSNIVQAVDFTGPTKFGPVISKALDIARKEKFNGNKVYTILQIMTDGIIDDMSETIDLLCAGADLPLSVIIIGVGDADFGQMKKLDGDDKILTNSRGVRTSRDIVQFVPFNNFAGNKERLAEEVLAEVPRQFLEYMRKQGIEPGPPVMIDPRVIEQNHGIQYAPPLPQNQQNVVINVNVTVVNNPVSGGSSPDPKDVKQLSNKV